MMKNLLPLAFLFSSFLLPAQGIFLYDSFIDRFWKINTLDQSVEELNVPWQEGNFTGLWLDETEMEIYISTSEDFGDGKNAIYKMDYEGNLLSTINDTDLSGPSDIIVDKSRGYIFFKESSENAINRINLDGTNITTLVSSTFNNIYGITYDQENGLLYYTADKRIIGLSIEGMTSDTLYEESSDANDFTTLAFNETNNQLFVYRVNDFIPGGDPGIIHQINIDTPELTNMVNVTDKGIERMVVNKNDNKLYWTSQLDYIERMNLDGTEREIAIQPSDYGIEDFDVGTWEGFGFFDITSSVKTVIPALNVEITPNPSNGNIFINIDESQGAHQINIYKVTGELVENLKLRQNNIHLGLSLQSGSYLLEIINLTTGKTAVQKILINND